jgi:diguanylate cyclase (GGDEF)-like protein
MRLPNTRSEHKNSLIVAAIVLISMGSLLLAFELGGVTLAVVFHALCVGCAARYFINEPHRVRSLVRERTLVLQDLAYRDGLTGLPNRRFFHWYVEQYSPRQATRLPRDQNMTSVVLFDLNGFKLINDNYGHDAGDELLKHLSDTLGANLPTDVLIARLGGDEFVAMVRDSEHGRKLASVLKIIRKSSKSPLVYQGERIQVSASVGVASTFRRRPVLGELLREADRNMYDDKASQRQQKESAPLRAMLNAELEL